MTADDPAVAAFLAALPVGSLCVWHEDGDPGAPFAMYRTPLGFVMDQVTAPEFGESVETTASAFGLPVAVFPGGAE